MDRRPPTVMVSLALLAAVACSPVAAPAQASSAPTTCLGKAVTIVATTKVTEGTEGDDVVAMVPEEWNTFDARGGNDTICLASDQSIVTDRGRSDLGEVDAGPGDDTVVNLTPAGTSASIAAVLGLGRDSFQGADMGETVYAEPRFAYSSPGPDFVADQQDVISGVATVYSSAPHDGPNTDRITFGAHGGFGGPSTTPGATAELDGVMSPQGVLDFSAAPAATLSMPAPESLATQGQSEVRVDNPTRTILAGTATALTWSGDVDTFELGFSFETLGKDDTDLPRVSFVGTDRAESVTFDDMRIGDVTLGGGNDELVVGGGPNQNIFGVPRSADGGPGRNSARIAVRCHRVLTVLADRSASCGDDVGTLTGFNDVDVIGNRTVTVTGTHRSETFYASGASVVVEGRGGDDRIVTDSYVADVQAGDGRDQVWAQGGDVEVRGGAASDDIVLLGFVDHRRVPGHEPRRVALGGRGRDILLGARDARPDRLVGGPGRDQADGRRGPRDYCSAEVVERCERP